jgi:SAM-dependent methyltransferase
MREQAAPTGHVAPLSYHGRLLGDGRRVAAYEQAIRRLVRPGMVVLDVGTGSGIFALLAARRGARVHAVESMPVAELARDLVRWNGLEHLITVHCADLVQLAPIEPVDLVIGDFLGRFLVDDWMLPVVAAAGRWLRPGGVFCPSLVRLHLAPCGDFTLPVVDIFRESFDGLDFSPAVAWATNSCYSAMLAPAALFAEPKRFTDFVPPVTTGLFDASLEFTFNRPGRLRALAGWFTANLAPGITLSTEPGVETHWGQHLFLLPETRVAAGDRIRVRLWLDDADSDPVWRWQGTVETSDGAAAFDFTSDEWLPPHPPLPAPSAAGQGRAAVLAAYGRGNDEFLAGRLAAAVSEYRVALAALSPAEDDLAGNLFENLGLALWQLGQHGEAARVLLRALDGDIGSREQALRGLVSCLFRSGRPLDGERMLLDYEQRYGRHPEQWSREGQNHETR